MASLVRNNGMIVTRWHPMISLYFPQCSCTQTQLYAYEKMALQMVSPKTILYYVVFGVTHSKWWMFSHDFIIIVLHLMSNALLYVFLFMLILSYLVLPNVLMHAFLCLHYITILVWMIISSLIHVARSGVCCILDS